MHEAWPEGRHARMSHPGPIFSRSIFDGGSDARTALDDAVRHGNNPYRCACPGSDVRSTFPGLHAGLQQRRELHRVWLYINGSVCSVRVRPRSSVLRQPILCTYRQESVSQGLSAANTRSTWRFKALMTPIRANIVGPPDVVTRINASMAACHSWASCAV